ncbi:MAG: hypothetical protein KUG53_01090 [Pseudomonadales bacterium]|nr:hypothetical protein [Pseudomonadales bacterium]
MLSHPLSRIAVALLMLIMFQPAWSDEYLPNPDINIAADAPAINIKNAKQPFPGILSGGQPTGPQLKEAQKKGYKTVISLQTRMETGVWDEAETVQELGMKYVSIPISNAAELNSENSKALIKALSDPDDYPILLHCGSGDRVGALFAVDAGLNRGIATEEALQIGRSAGMKRLEGPVKEILD